MVGLGARGVMWQMRGLVGVVRVGGAVRCRWGGGTYRGFVR